MIRPGRPPELPEIRAWPVFRVMADGKERTGLAISQSNAVKRFMYQSSARCISTPPDPRRSHVRITSQQVEFPSQPVAPTQEHADFGSTTGDRDLRVRLYQESVHPWRVGDMPASNESSWNRFATRNRLMRLRMRSAPTLQGGDSGELLPEGSSHAAAYSGERKRTLLVMTSLLPVIAVFDLGRRALDQGVFIGTVRRLQQTSSRSSQAQNSGYLPEMRGLTDFVCDRSSTGFSVWP